MQQETCWTLLRDAAGGNGDARAEFSELYLPAVRSTLEARWRGRPEQNEVDDAVQEVMLECLRADGVVDRALERAENGFRAFLYGAIRNVALRTEKRRAAARDQPRSATFHADGHESPETSLSDLFDRQWAHALMREAGKRFRQRADENGGEARRRVELLELRFTEGLPIRDIAKRWDEDPARVHHAYARARDEFRQALREALEHHLPRGAGDLDGELERVLAHLAHG